MTNQPPKDVRNRLEAEIAALQAALIDADVEYVGHDPDYVPEGPALRGEFEVQE